MTSKCAVSESVHGWKPSWLSFDGGFVPVEARDAHVAGLIAVGGAVVIVEGEIGVDAAIYL